LTIIKASQSMGQTPKFAKILPHSTLETVGRAAGICMFLGIGTAYVDPDRKTIPEPPPIVYAGIVVSSILFDMLIRGDEPYKFDTQFWRGKKVTRVGASHDATKSIEPQKVPKPKLLDNPIENEFELIAYLDYQMEYGKRVGAYLIKTPGFYKVIFGYNCKTYCSSISPGEASRVMKQVREGLKLLPEDETLTFRQGTWKDLPPQPTPRSNKLMTILEYWAWSRLKGQVELGRRTVKTLRAYASYTIGGSGSKAEDPFDRFQDAVRFHWEGTFKPYLQMIPVLGSFFRPQNVDNLPEILEKAYQHGFKSRSRLLNNQLGLASTPYTCDELWEIDYKAWNDGSVPNLPYRIVITPNGCEIVQESEEHLISALCKLGSPKLDNKRSVLLPGGNKIVRGAVWDRNRKPLTSYDDAIEDDNLQQMLFGSSFINDSRGPGTNATYGEVYDTELIVQFSGISQRETHDKARKLEDENIWAKKMAASQGNETSQTKNKLNKSQEVRDRLFDGEHGVSVAVAALVYRDTPKEADDAIQSFTDRGFQGGYMFPENEYFPHIWKETLPFASNPLLKHYAWGRRMEDFTSFTAAFVPLLADNSIDTEGLEFQSHYGSTPFYVPTVTRKRTVRKVTLGGSGSGKSLLVIAGDVVSAYMDGIPSFIIDATQGNSSTFTHVCNALGGTIFRCRIDYFNLLQGADTRSITDPEDLEMALSLLRTQWSTTLTGLAWGDRPDADTKSNYSELSEMLIATWMEDPVIQARYHRAYDDGFGSDAWLQIPTLKEFVDLATIDRLPVLSQTEDNRKLLIEYQSRLSAFMRTDPGKHVSRPSTFDINSPIVVCVLGGINDMAPKDVFPYVSAVTALTTSAALTFTCVNIIGDEASKLSKYDCFMSAFGGYFSGGRKEGISAQIIGQDLPSIQSGLNSSLILDNVTDWQIARVTEKAGNYLADKKDGIGFPIELLRQVDENSPPIPHQEGYKLWAIRSRGRTVVARLSISFFLMAISVNEPWEIEERQKYLDQYPGDPLLGYVEYGKSLRSKTVDGQFKKQTVRAA
jgi:hypothetical protein